MARGWAAMETRPGAKLNPTFSAEQGWQFATLSETMETEGKRCGRIDRETRCPNVKSQLSGLHVG